MARQSHFTMSTFGFGPAAMAADPAIQQSGTTPALATAEFVTSAAAGNQFEIDSSKLALSRTRSDAVKRFAQRMVEDHTDAAAKFKTAAAEAKLSPPGAALDAKHRAVGKMR
jgi:putative membrane protein